MKDIAFSLCGTLLGTCLALGGGGAAGQSCNVRGWYNSSAVPIIGEISVPFVNMPEHGGLSVGFDDHAVFSEFSRPGEDEMDVLIETTYPQARPCYDADRDSTVLSMPGGPMPKCYLVGERKVVVVVGSGIAVKSLTLGEIGGILAGEEKDKDGKPVPGAARGEGKSQPGTAVPQSAGIHVYCEPDKSWCRWALSAWCMQYVEQKKGYKILGHHPFRDDITDCVDGDEVIAKVKRDPRGIGFFQYRPGEKLPASGVRFLAISDAKGKPPVAFKEGDVLQPDYPLAEPILLYLHPKAPPLAKEFCEFAIGKQAAGIAAKYGVITAYAQKQAEGEERLREAAAGTGVRITAVGPGEAAQLLRDLAGQYTHDRATVQMGYLSDGGPAAVGEFLEEKKDLLILDEEDAKRLAAKIRPLPPLRGGVAVEGKCFCAKAAAIVVNAVNPLKSLGEADLADVLAGKSREWKDVEIAGPALAGKDRGEIHVYDAGGEDSADLIVARKLELRGMGRAIRRGSDADVIEAVATDPEGIAVVDLAELPANLKKAGVRLIAIGDGKDVVSPIPPTPATVLDGTYPLAARFSLYAAGGAGETPRDFARFIAEPGTEGDVFRKDGFISLPAGAQQH